MIFLMNAQGGITHVSPESVKLGSINANELVVIAPFKGTLTMGVKLPNGLVLKEPISFGTPDELALDEWSVFVYHRSLPTALTAIPGTLVVQLFLVTKQGELPSDVVTIPISKGARYFEEVPEDANIEYLVSLTESAEAAAEAAEKVANEATEEANTFKTELTTLRDETGTMKNSIFTWYGLTTNAASAAQTARNEAVAARDSAVAARDEVKANLDNFEGSIAEKLASNGAEWDADGALKLPDGKGIKLRASVVNSDGDTVEDARVAHLAYFPYEGSFGFLVKRTNDDGSEDEFYILLPDPENNTATLATEDYVFGQLENYAKKTDLAKVYKFQGSVATVGELPSEGVVEGYVYNVTESGANYAATFDADGNLVWDDLGGIEDLSNYFTKDEINDIIANLGESGTKVKVGGEVVKEFDADTKVTAPTSYPNFDSIIVHEANGNMLGVGVDAGNGLAVVKGSNPRLVCSTANQSLILAKTEMSKPIAPNNLDYAVKVGVTTNTLPLTDEEKQKAQIWIGVDDHEKRIENLESTLLTYTEDTDSAYEKAVPVGVAPNAILDSIGGATYRSNNYLNPALFGLTVTDDGGVIVPANTDSLPLVVGSASVTLAEGIWYIKGADFGTDYTDTKGTITLTEETSVSIIVVAAGYNEEHTVYPMLSKDEKLPFEPYYPTTDRVPVTEVKSVNIAGEVVDTYTIPSGIINEVAGSVYGKPDTLLDFDNKQYSSENGTHGVAEFLTDYTDFKLIKVQPGGKLIFVNEYEAPVPSTVTYVKRKE